jgi:hypothetical protein
VAIVTRAGRGGQCGDILLALQDRSLLPARRMDAMAQRDRSKHDRARNIN